MGEDGSPRSFSRLEYMNVHRIRFHAPLGLSQIYAGRASALNLPSHSASISKKGLHKAGSKSYAMGNRALLAFYAELEGACIAHKALLASSGSDFVAHFVSQASKYDGQKPTRRPPTQCIICRGDLHVFDALPSPQQLECEPTRLAEPTSPIVASNVSPLAVSECEIDDLCEKITSLPPPTKGRASCLAQRATFFIFYAF